MKSIFFLQKIFFKILVSKKKEKFYSKIHQKFFEFFPLNLNFSKKMKLSKTEKITNINEKYRDSSKKIPVSQNFNFSRSIVLIQFYSCQCRIQFFKIYPLNPSFFHKFPNISSNGSTSSSSPSKPSSTSPSRTGPFVTVSSLSIPLIFHWKRWVSTRKKFKKKWRNSGHRLRKIAEAVCDQFTGSTVWFGKFFKNLKIEKMPLCIFLLKQ